MTKKKKITLEELAAMVKRGFDEAAKAANARFDETVTRADIVSLKADIARLEKEIAELREDIAHLKQIPFTLERRIDRMEDDIRLIKTKVGVR